MCPMEFQALAGGMAMQALMASTINERRRNFIRVLSVEPLNCEKGECGRGFLRCAAIVSLLMRDWSENIYRPRRQQSHGGKGDERLHHHHELGPSRENRHIRR